MLKCIDGFCHIHMLVSPATDKKNVFVGITKIAFPTQLFNRDQSECKFLGDL